LPHAAFFAPAFTAIIFVKAAAVSPFFGQTLLTGATA